MFPLDAFILILRFSNIGKTNAEKRDNLVQIAHFLLYVSVIQFFVTLFVYFMLEAKLHILFVHDVSNQLFLTCTIIALVIITYGLVRCVTSSFADRKSNGSTIMGQVK